MLWLEVFGQQAIDLQQPVASQPHLAVIDRQVAGGCLVAERFGELGQHVHTELASEWRGFTVYRFEKLPALASIKVKGALPVRIGGCLQGFLPCSLTIWRAGREDLGQRGPKKLPCLD